MTDFLAKSAITFSDHKTLYLKPQLFFGGITDELEEIRGGLFLMAEIDPLGALHLACLIRCCDLALSDIKNTKPNVIGDLISARSICKKHVVVQSLV